MAIDQVARGMAAQALLGESPVLDLPTRLGLEGIRDGNDGTTGNTGVVVPTGARPGAGDLIAGTAISGICYATWIESLVVTLSDKADAQLWAFGAANTPATHLPTPVARIQTSAALNGLVIPIKQLCPGAADGAGGYELRVRNNLTGGDVTYFGSVSWFGYRIADDFNYGAPFTILIVGDSTSAGTGPTTTAKSLATQIAAYFKSIGQNCRIILRAVSGTNTSDHETYRQAGWFDFPQVDLCIRILGINDAEQSVASATVIANETAFQQWFFKMYSGSRLLTLGTGPLQQDASEAFAVQYRAALAAYIPAQNNSNYFYINLGTAFDRKTTSFYVNTDTPGNLIHPNDTGIAAEYSNCVQPGIIAQKIFL